MATKDDWKAAKAALATIEAERNALVEPTNARFAEAVERLEAVVEELDCGDFLGTCVGCSEPIFEGDRYHSGPDENACAECAPSFADMLAQPQHFLDYTTDDEMTPERARAICDAHIAKGGSLTDKMVSP